MIGLGLLLLLVVGDHSPARAAVPQERATLLVDFQALDAAGNPVTDLRPSELILRAGGRERRLVSLELVRRDTSEVAPDRGMPPGDLVMRAIVSMAGKPVGRALRTPRKVK